MKIYFFDNDNETINTFQALLPKLRHKECTEHINIPSSVFLNMLANDKSGIVFLDTRNTDVQSFALAKNIRSISENIHIVFMSSHIEDMPFCLKNLLRPSGFLLKPIDENDFLAIINSVLKSKQKSTKKVEKICISTHSSKRTLNVKDILYFSTQGKKIICRTIDGEILPFYDTITALAERYADDFIRCHSGFLANRHWVLGMKKGMLEIKNCDENLPVSKKYRPVVSTFLRGTSH